jgi:hypothetical protein
MPKAATVILCLALLAGLQVIKPSLFMETYRFAFDFNPTLYSNWALYKMVWSNVLAGTMAAKVTVPLLLGEALLIVAPIGLWKLLSPSQPQQGDTMQPHERRLL